MKAGVGKIPTVAKAGAKFNIVKAAAGDVPVNTVAADEAVARAQELGKAGANVPKVMRDFAKARQPITGKFAGNRVQMSPDPITYQTGRDFASNAGALSVDEATKMTPSMKAQVKQFARAMDEGNRGAAATGRTRPYLPAVHRTDGFVGGAQPYREGAGGAVAAGFGHPDTPAETTGGEGTGRSPAQRRR